MSLDPILFPYPHPTTFCIEPRKGTHVDFLLYRAIGKEPVAAIEVDGISFHRQGSRQYDRDRLKDSIFAGYSLPLLRFRTDGSGERESMHSFLYGYIGKG